MFTEGWDTKAPWSQHSGAPLLRNSALNEGGSGRRGGAHKPIPRLRRGRGGKMRRPLFPALVTAVVVLLLPPADAFVQAAGQAAKRGRGGMCAGAGALRMQQQDPRRRRMLRIAELRREIATDVQRKSDELRDSYKITRDRLGGQPPPQQFQRDAKTAADAAVASAAAAAAAAAAASASASADKTGSNIAGTTYLDRLSLQTNGAVDSGASKKSGSFSKAEVTQPMAKGRRRKQLKEVQGDGFLLADGDASANDKLTNDKFIPYASPGEEKMDRLLRERRTSFERRKWGTTGEEEDDASGSNRPRTRWGPKQLINGPPDMRLKRILRYQGQASLRGAGMDLDDDGVGLDLDDAQPPRAGLPSLSVCSARSSSSLRFP